MRKKEEIDVKERRNGCERIYKWMREKGEMYTKGRRNGCERKEKWMRKKGEMDVETVLSKISVQYLSQDRMNIQFKVSDKFIIRTS